MNKKMIIELRGKAQMLTPTVHIGKDGISDTVVEETMRQLKNAKLVKIKLLGSLDMEKTEAAEKLAEATDSTLVEIRGFTVVLARD